MRPRPARPLGQRLRDWVEWFGVARIAVVALSVVVVGAGGYWLLRGPATPVESSLPRAGAATSTLPSVVPSTLPAATATTEMEPSTIVVHVAGGVAVPGVYELSPGARVVDAIAAAGGVAATAAPDAINQAQPLRDGDRVYVPRADDLTGVPAGVTAAAGAAEDEPVASGPVDLNSATVEQLDALPGVGPSTAAAIVAHRDANGPFASVDGLDAVRGIGPTKLEALRGLVTV